MYVKEAAASSIVPDGLHMWKEDQGWVATSTATDYQSNSGLLRHTANALSLKVQKRMVAPTYNEPRKNIGTSFIFTQKLIYVDSYNYPVTLLWTYNIKLNEICYSNVAKILILEVFNPLYASRLFHCYIIDESICHFRGIRSILCYFVMENPVSKQCCWQTM